MKHQKHFSIDKNGYTIDGILQTNEIPSDKIAILLHGGPQGSKDGPDNIFGLIADKLLESNIDSIRFDFMGQGNSTGDYINMTMAQQASDYLDVLNHAQNTGYKNIAAVGESFGGSCLLNGINDNVKAICLLWPAIYLLDKTFAGYLEEGPQNELKNKGFIQEGKDKIGQHFIDELIKVDNLEAKVKEITVPTLLIHGKEDSEVPYTQSEKAYNLLKEPKKIIIVPGADHCLRKPQEQALVVAEVNEWLRKYL